MTVRFGRISALAFVAIWAGSISVFAQNPPPKDPPKPPEQKKEDQQPFPERRAAEGGKILDRQQHRDEEDRQLGDAVLHAADAQRIEDVAAGLKGCRGGFPPALWKAGVGLPAGGTERVKG